MKFSLIKNAKDSLEHAIEHFVSSREVEAADLKRVILDITHVLELVLKERLIRTHPAFVYKDIDKYPCVDPYTVSTDLAMKRLTKICQINFTKADELAIEDCRKKRNQIEHFEFELNTAEAKLVIGKLLSFILSFSKFQLGLNWENEFVINPNWQCLKELSYFWEEHSKRILEQLEKDKISTDYCPICSSFTLDMESAKCHLCGHIDRILKCRKCEEEFFEYTVFDPEIELCSNCEWEGSCQPL